MSRKPVVIHKTAHQAGDFSAGFQALSHFRATQVEVAVFQTRFFGVDVVRVKRQNICAIDDSSEDASTSISPVAISRLIFFWSRARTVPVT